MLFSDWSFDLKSPAAARVGAKNRKGKEDERLKVLVERRSVLDQIRFRTVCECAGRREFSRTVNDVGPAFD